ncbi:MAG: hypothetical protein HFG26_11135 [Provencibacterium sp.]|jgi:hypothetical protein|nr:hypothetical protein [Provencibacterium sp.]
MDALSRPRGLNAFTLKIIAIASMTLDHLYFYLYKAVPLPIGLRILGRLAAPIFLYLIAWSFDYTRSRPRFLLRLYLWSAGVELFALAVNARNPDPPGFPLDTHISITLFSIVFCLYALRQAREARKAGKAGCVLLWISALAALWLFPVYLPLLLPAGPAAFLRALLPSPFFADGGPALVLFGTGLYFVKDRPWALGVYYSLYSLLSIRLHGSLQVYMIFALPLLLSYNRRRGPRLRLFFYLYYPLHAYLLFELGVLLSRRMG